MKRKYKVVAKYEFEMVGSSANEVANTLEMLLDSLVECHSNVHTGNDPDFPEHFTGKYPRRMSTVATRINNKKS